MRVGVLTGRGDCPGLNAVIRAVVRKGEVEHGDAFVGFRDGWRGLTESVFAWVIATAGIPTDQLQPPARGRAPEWSAGVAVAGLA